MSQKRNLEIHTLPQGSLLWFIPHFAVSIKGVHLYKKEISFLNKGYTYFIIEADSLGVTGVWTYYSSGDVHLEKRVITSKAFGCSILIVQVPGVLLKIVMSTHSAVRLIRSASTAPA